MVNYNKMWYGRKHYEDGERQLWEYPDRYHLDKGYLVTFSFLKEKKVGVEERFVDEKVLVEAVVELLSENVENFMYYS